MKRYSKFIILVIIVIIVAIVILMRGCNKSESERSTAAMEVSSFKRTDEIQAEPDIESIVNETAEAVAEGTDKPSKLKSDNEGVKQITIEPLPEGLQKTKEVASEVVEEKTEENEAHSEHAHEEAPAPSQPSPQTPSQESASTPSQPAQPAEPVHTHSYSTGKSATCTENGYTVCSCGNTQTIPAYGHNYSGGSCTNCGASDPNWVPPHEHNYQVAGSKFVCKRCGYATYNFDDCNAHALECESGWYNYVIYRCECGDEYIE